MGSPHNLWEPALWEGTSGIVFVALLPLIRCGAMLFRFGAVRPFTAAAAIALALVFSALHIIGMGLLRELAYGLAGWTYIFPWSHQILYELRKYLFRSLAFSVLFSFPPPPVHPPP